MGSVSKAFTDEEENSLASVAEFYNATGLQVRTSIASKPYTTFCIGGPLQYFVEPNSDAEVIAAVKCLREFGVNYRILGGGSNLLISDDGVPGWTLRLGKGFRILKELKDGVFEVGGSMSLMSLCRELSEAGYSGLEFSGGIPAAFGGAIFMNAGAHGGEISEILKTVKVVTTNGKVEIFNRKDLEFSYRKSFFPANSIVIGGTISLVSGSKDKIITKRIEFLSERKKRQPLTLPSAGSVFKNPGSHESQTAGSLIEKVGLKGRSSGGAEISDLHANWIVNPEKKASSKDVLELMDLCRDGVKERFSIELDPELIFWR